MCVKPNFPERLRSAWIQNYGKHKVQMWKAFHNTTFKLHRSPQWSLGNLPQSSLSNPTRSKLWGIRCSFSALKNIRSKRYLQALGIPRLVFILVSHVYWQCLGLPINSHASKTLLGKPPHLMTWKRERKPCKIHIFTHTPI